MLAEDIPLTLMKRACLFLLVLTAIKLQAQDVRRDAMSPYTIRGNMGIQKPLTSGKFQQSFAGLYEGNISFNARIGTNFSAGFGYQNTYFKNNQFLKRKISNAQLPYHTSLICDGAFLRLGYDRFFRTNGFVSYALNGGYTFCRYTNVNNDSSAANSPYPGKTFNSPYIQPEVSFNFVMEQRLAFSLFLSYTTMFYKYDARAPRLNHFPEIEDKGNSFPMSYFSFGFGFTVLLGK